MRSNTLVKGAFFTEMEISWENPFAETCIQVTIMIRAVNFITSSVLLAALLWQ
jgi:hypothetical protein